MTGTDSSKRQHYDVVIVGAGPAGLATLSALQESFSLDHLTDTQRNQILSVRTKSTKKRNVCVIDPSGGWMTDWNENFSKLEINFLRSPAMAHPDAFDEDALLAFAVAEGRQDELLASGCSDIVRLRSLREAHNGLWDMPSSKLFYDFCQATTKRLPHDFLSDAVVDIETSSDKKQTQSKRVTHSLTLKSGDTVTADAVVLAMGALGKPIIPKRITQVPESRLMHWTSLDASLNTHGIPSDWKDILVVGGGLTAVQVAQLALRHGDSNRKVTLCSRRPLVEKHLDIGLDWVDRRKVHKCQSDFYHQSLQDRLSFLKMARGGGSVPPFYMRQVEELESQGRLKRLVGSPNFIYSEEMVLGREAFDNDNNMENCDCCREQSPLVIGIGSQVHRFDGVVAACGIRPDCTQNPVCQNLIHNNSTSPKKTKVFSGLPIISEDLEWYPNIFVVGGMASLNLGPDGGNLMGMRRGATIVANTLGCRSWLRDKGNVLANRFSLFADDEDTSDTEDEDTDTESDSE